MKLGWKQMRSYEQAFSVSTWLLVAAFGGYIWQAVMQGYKPHPPSWGIWAGMSWLHAWSYHKTVGNFRAAKIYYASALLNTLVFAIALFVGEFTMPEVHDLYAAVSAGVVLLVWWRFKEHRAGNVGMLATACIGFYVLAQALVTDPTTEDWRMWAIWTIAFLIQLLGAHLKYDYPEHLPNERERTKWLYVSPVVYTLLHGLVAVLAAR